MYPIKYYMVFYMVLCIIVLGIIYYLLKTTIIYISFYRQL